jgi:Protein of unknown function (DUF1549)/Protein of unknown function (DUF1553)
MFSDSDDPILDACLDEVLSNRNPPDLTARIMQALAKRGAVQRAGGAAPEHAAALPDPPPPVLAGLERSLGAGDSQPVVELRGAVNRRDRRRDHESNRLVVIAAACIAGLGLAIGITAYFTSTSQRSPIATSPAAPATKLPGSVASVPRHDVQTPSQPAPKTPAVDLAVDNVPPPPPVDSNPNQPASNQPPSIPSAVAQSPPSPLPVPVRDGPKIQPSPDAQVVAFVNTELARGWDEAGIKPAPPATDAEWCQRLFVRVLGRNPTADQRQAYLDDKSSDRREKLVEQLLTDATLVRRFARHWSVVWADALLGRAGGQAASPATREELENYLRTSLVASKPFDKIAAELLTASGSARPGADDYNPAVNFLIDALDANATVPTSRVARVLLGHQLQCAQCHADPSHGWSQEQYWALNSFFRQMRANRQGEVPRLVNADFQNKVRGGDGGEVLYETPSGEMKTALPRFLDGTEIPASGKLAEVDRRRELARLVVQSDDLPKAVVNRVWGQFFDYGLVGSLDELTPDSTSPRSQVLDRLAAEFAARDFDLKSLVRWTALSDAFNRSSKLTDLASKDMPEEGELPLFSRYYGRPTHAAGVFDALVQAARIRNTAASDSERQKARVDWVAQSIRDSSKAAAKGGKKGGKAPAAPSGSDSSLMVKGATSIQRTSSRESSGLVTKIAASSLAFDKKVEHLFLAALARPPAPREQRAAADLLRTTKDDQVAALTDIWWSLLNSAECVIDR